MGKAPPAFQFYPDIFEQGTDTMTLSEVGGYIRLLNSQWAKGSIPGHDIAALSRIMRCTPNVAKSIWKVLEEKFNRDDDGSYRNARLEKERAKQARFRASQAAKGKASAEARLQPDGNRGSTAVGGSVQPTRRFNPPISDLRSPEVVIDPPTPTPQRPDGPRDYDRTHTGHIMGFCLFKCLTDKKIAEFARDLPGGLENPANFDEVFTWAEGVRNTWGDKPKREFEWFKFWEARWKERVGASREPSNAELTRAAFARAEARGQG